VPAVSAVCQRRLLPFFVLSVTLTLWAARCFAIDVPPLQGRVNDLAQLLSPEVRQSLTERLAAYEKATGHQLAILTIPTLGGEPIEDFSMRVVERWKLGQKGKDDGILLLVAARDHKMRIEVGYGLEGALPDALAGRIVRDTMAPDFRKGDFAGGITAAVNEVLAKTGGGTLAQGATSPTPTSPAQGGETSHAGPLTFIAIVGLMIALLFKFAFFGIFGLVLLAVVLLNFFGGRGFGGGYYGGGFGAGGSGSGGFGGGFSGGGGSFGGGGASGSW
jgi:uncharacterized protein